MTDDDLNLTQWSAVVALLVVLLVPLAVAGAAWARRRYVRAITALQADLARGDGGVQLHRPTAPPNRTPLDIDLMDADQVAAATGGTPATGARRLRRRVLGVQFTAGLLYWWLLLCVLLVAGVVWWQMSGEPALGDPASDEGAANLAETLATQLVLWPLLVLPAVLGWAFQAGLPEDRVWLGAGLTVAAFGLGLVGSGAELGAALVLATAAAMLAALLAAFLRPAVRGAGPPLVAALTIGLVVFAFGVAFAAAFDDGEDSETTAEDWLWASLYLLLVLGLAGAAAWRMLLRLARRYEERRFSDQQMALHAYWALITGWCGALVLAVSFDARTQHAMEWMAAVVLVAWFGWRALERVALWWARRGAPAPCGALLMLRVFKPSARSEAFTDRFLARWRFAGPTWMIAGPDLAGGHLEPDEFFAFLRGRLREHFIVDPAEIAPRLQSLDSTRDPDGRCRVHELFCSNATWRETVLALMDRAGAVLLDLREYHPGRLGTRFELEAVLQRVPLQRLVVLVAAGDDPAVVEAEVRDAWRLVDPRGRSDESPRLTVLSVDQGSAAEMHGLLAACAAATTGAGDTQR
ncbi:hypothetical protein [Rubrivivax albus]|uniref:Uncharacterized protein n=1 Tax=Rubrivivax albus TaxID=2499835 RepID=A0A3S3SEN9_9BURK|nr:hypothetical protein [Rubrivivax albus]RVT53762.1 hypothetical protein ENE75_02400 [Rubrivivax albus]